MDMPAPEHAIAIDLGGTKCAAALVAADGKIGYSRSIKYERADDVGALINQIIADLISRARKNHSTISGIGISVPGISDPEKGTVWAPNIKGWDHYPLRQVIIEQLPVPGLPVSIESDRGCSILGENWLGAARGADHAIFLAVGTGIGAGILSGNQIIRGWQDSAGAVGWMALQRPYNEKLTRFGCFEYYASGDGLIRAAREFLPDRSTALINKDTIDAMTAENLFDAYGKGDLLAQMVLDQAIEFWGMASANLVSLFNPEIIIFGGGVFGPATQFLDRIYEEAKKWAQPIAIQQVRFMKSMLSGNAPLLGAAFLAFKNASIKQKT